MTLLHRTALLLFAFVVFASSSLPAVSSDKSTTKGTEPPPQDAVKIQIADPDSRIHFLYRGKKLDLPATSFHARCKGYSSEGVKYSSPAGEIVIAWKDIDFILPSWKEGFLRDRKSFMTEALLPAACSDAHLSVVTKKKVVVTVKGAVQEKTVKEEILYPLNEISVFAFDQKGVERGIAELAKKGVVVEPETGLELVLVRGGCYPMGEVVDESEGQTDEVQMHQVCVGDLYLGRTEVTQNQWQALMPNNPAFFNTCGNCPVENVSWFDAQDFIRALNQKTGKVYRLPTEAEWEFAARSSGKKEKIAGMTTGGSGAIGEYAWFASNTNGHSASVATRMPNHLGFFDMSGNVSEWVQDRYASDYYRSSPKDDPAGPGIGDHRVNRGGGWNSPPARLRTSFRDHDNASVRRNNLGFRIAISAKQMK